MRKLEAMGGECLSAPWDRDIFWILECGFQGLNGTDARDLGSLCRSDPQNEEVKELA